MAQSVNLDAVLYFPVARYLRRSLAVPHFFVPDIRYTNPETLRRQGFKGVVFDKDNTLTAPYVNEIFPPLQDAFSDYQRVFGDRVVILSNSAGTRDDTNYEDATRIEKDIGVHVLRHTRKKPAGVEAVKDYFGCSPQDIVMVGDRVFTDVVFGNRHGMLTILTQLLTEKGDNKAAAKVRTYEYPLVQRWIAQGLSAPSHARHSPDIVRQPSKRVVPPL